jgi:hypothetical protein
MAKVSGASVARALKQVARQTKTTVRQINQKAAALVNKGDYGNAETLVVLAKSVNDFAREVELMCERWRSLVSGSGRGRTDQTPLWEFYKPILRVLEEMGGQATAKDLERRFEAACVPALKSGDLAMSSSGLVRWKRALVRARSAMIKEGFIERDGKGAWRTTAAGRRAANG